MIEPNKYYKPRASVMHKYVSTLWVQSVSILKQMLKHGDGKFYVQSVNGNMATVAGNPADALIGTMTIPIDALDESTGEEEKTFGMTTEGYKFNMVRLDKRTIDDKIKQTLIESGFSRPSTEFKADASSVSNDFDAEASIKSDSVTTFATSIGDLETSFGAIVSAMQKCSILGVGQVGHEGYPFSESLDEMYKKIMKWNIEQQIAVARMNGK